MPPSIGSSRLQADLQAAGQIAIPCIQGIAKGDVEDEFVFSFVDPDTTHGRIAIRVLPQDIASYPKGCSYLVYTDDKHVPPEIGVILGDAMTTTAGMRVADFLATLSRRLRDSSKVPGEEGNDNGDDYDIAYADTDEDMQSQLASDDTDAIMSDWTDENEPRRIVRPVNTIVKKLSESTIKRIRSDFRDVWNAGFRISKISGVDHHSPSSIITMSVRTSKLGLSHETLAAWGLETSDYLILLVKYSGDYLTLENALQLQDGHRYLEFRLRRYANYRPTEEEAFAAFSLATAESGSGQSVDEPPKNHKSLTPRSGLLTFWVASSLELFLNADFLSMMRIRRCYKVSWDDANRIRSQRAMAGGRSQSVDFPPLSSTDPCGIVNTSLPPFLADDHLMKDGLGSLLLVEMQFTLYYLVKCNDYCMICHDKNAQNLESLKPYVCDKPLCLFQYMNLGLGLNIDHEIVNQERVVDLLISFCYASLNGTIRDKPMLRGFPLGLDLQVPCVKPRSNIVPIDSDGIAIGTFGVLIEPLEVDVSWTGAQATMTSYPGAHSPPLKIGQWVVIYTKHDSSKYPLQAHNLGFFHYARIEMVTGRVLQFQIASRHPVPMTVESYRETQDWDWNDTGRSVGHLVRCNRSLDDIDSDLDKAFSLTLLLSILPSVTEMRSYLVANKSRRLETWGRIPPPAMKFLKWIVASNRSCIVELDNDNTEDKVGGLSRSQERVLGVDGWIQFRFAQGSPEKEALFLSALRDVESPVRTLLAWHGSRLGNWHSIIREGLNHDVVANGRSFGDGVYFSPSFDVSEGYSGTTKFGEYEKKTSAWPQSSLHIIGALSLNELINRPHDFKHSTSCYVVDILHWIQCRYLFVRPAYSETTPVNPIKNFKEDTKRVDEFVQDQRYRACGPKKQEIFVPRIIMSSAQRQQQQHAISFHSLDGTNGYVTDVEDAEDKNFLIDEDGVISRTASFKTTPVQDPKTDFRPGTIDYSKLPRLALPAYATKIAQQTIQRELQKTQKVQSSTAPHELGWYIDFDMIDNMFQWIVELHSFDPSLPLAQDMKEAGIVSIVLEIRFLRDYPLEPPFVRVIQPRFRSFAQGGGGHVTAGGAMCMELLTSTGWSPANTMESVLLQVRLAMCSNGRHPARLMPRGQGPNQYGIREAMDAYTRAAGLHGWVVPRTLKEAAMQE